jgi:hypothetical protein
MKKITITTTTTTTILIEDQIKTDLKETTPTQKNRIKKSVDPDSKGNFIVNVDNLKPNGLEMYFPFVDDDFNTILNIWFSNPWSEKTKSGYMKSLRKFLLYTNITSIKEIDSKSLFSYRKLLIDEGYSLTTQVERYSIITRFCNFLIKEKFISDFEIPNFK